MDTIATLATKGGAGRSTTVMALACGFLALGKRVAVMDCTGQVGWQMGRETPTTLEAWGSHMQSSDYASGHLELTQCQSRRQIEDKWATAEARGVEFLLIDTQHRLEDRQSAAMGLADLVIAPATGSIEARCTAACIQDILGFPEHLFGIVTGCRNGEAEVAQTRAAFGNNPVFLSELPCAEALADITLFGDIARFASTLACKNKEAGYARYKDALDAWHAVQQLTLEVHWALKGYRLHPFSAEIPKYVFQTEAVA